MVAILRVSSRFYHKFDPTESYHRTDFMGDMAFVPQYFSDGADANSVCLRFGGGFELMKAGRDVDGVWTLIESAIWYVLIY